MNTETMSITVSGDAKVALGYALDLAYGDQRNYLSYASPAADYGSDWPDVARNKAKQFRALGDFGESIGFYGEKDRWGSLADDFMATLEDGEEEL